MNYIDSHCHLNDEQYKEDLNQVLDNMATAGVTKAMIISLTPEEYDYSKTIKHPKIEFKHSLGIFPDNINLTDDEFEEYVKRMKEDECDAIGECGLDYYWYKDTKEQQKELFIKQIELAKSLNKTVIVHARDAMQDCFDILKEHKCKALLHCYSGSSEMAEEFIKLGYYISIAGTITYKNAKEPLEVIKKVSLNRLLIETDSPYLTPVPYRGKRNDPSKVIFTAQKIIDELNIDKEEFLNQINLNYETIFK